MKYCDRLALKTDISNETLSSESVTHFSSTEQTLTQTTALKTAHIFH